MYQIQFVKGDYSYRQYLANLQKCDSYVEHHFNSSKKKQAKYCLGFVGSNASQKSQDLAAYYAQKIHETFGVPKGGRNGVMQAHKGGRGDGNLVHTDMCAILLEPLFGSNPQHAKIIKSEQGQEQLAKALVDTIVHFFPKGAKIAFSVGHKYKKSKPFDRGAKLWGGGYEADYAELVLNKAADMLRNIRNQINDNGENIFVPSPLVNHIKGICEVYKNKCSKI